MNKLMCVCEQTNNLNNGEITITIIFSILGISYISYVIYKLSGGGHNDRWRGRDPGP
jgi:hypothetical protein